MGLISRVSSRTYRKKYRIFSQKKVSKKSNMANIEKKVEQEFSAMKDFLDQKQMELERNHLRKIENGSYLCAANCTKDASMSTRETRDCVIKCMKPMETVQNMWAKRQAQINGAIENCMTRCEEQVKLKVGDNPNEQQMETARVAYLECSIECPKRVTPVISQAFQDMKFDLQGASFK